MVILVNLAILVIWVNLIVLSMWVILVAVHLANCLERLRRSSCQLSGKTCRSSCRLIRVYSIIICLTVAAAHLHILQ